MSIVQRRWLRSSKGENLDNGITVKNALKLIEKSIYYDEIYKAFNLKELENDFIAIKGANFLVKELIEVDEEYSKFDVDSASNDVRITKFTDNNEAEFEIFNISNKEVLKVTGSDMILMESAYSVKSEYLNDLYHIDKYLDFCIKSKYHDIVEQNLVMIQEKNKDNNKLKNFRVLQSPKGKYYVRAITSVDKYKDYNLRFSLFIALIELHLLIKDKFQTYFIESYNITESDARIVFKNKQIYDIDNNTKLGFAFELINDEIKREAVKFNGIFSFTFGNSSEFFVKSEEINSHVSSFTHSSSIETVKIKLNDLSGNIDDFISNTIDDAKKIRITDKPDLLRDHLLYKISNGKSPEFNTSYKDQVKSLLSNKVKTIVELCVIFDKVSLLIQDEHVSSLDFWRSKLYQVLFEEVNKTKQISI